MEKLKRIGFTKKDEDIWREGEGEYLEKLIGFGFKNTLFSRDGDSVMALYDPEECEEFEEALSQILDEEFFDEICEKMFEIVESGLIPADQRLRELTPILTIFDEMSKYPAWGNEAMLRRLERVRKETHDFSYKLRKMVNAK